MWVIAHRGFSGRHPENTLKAFKAAEELGCDMVECDVHTSRDGHLVIIHDANLERTTTGTGPVAEKTLAELKALDAGEGETIPTLEELLDTVTVPVVVELKSPATVAPLAGLFRGRPELKDRLWPISFGHPLIRLLTEAAPGITAGVLYAGVPVEPWRLAEAAGAKILLPSVETATAWEVRAAHQHDLYYAVWTADTPEEIAKVREIGVDGAASNYPDRLLQEG